MTIEQLNENKLKITLLNSELESYFPHEPNISPGSPSLKKFIISIIRKAARETGFEAAGSNIMVESVAKNDRLIFLITKLSGSVSQARKKPRRLSLKVSTGAPNIRKNSFAYFIFPDRKSFMEFFYTVRREDFSASALFIMSGRYYFKTQTEKRLYILATEFANPICSQLLTIQLAKDATLVCSGESFYKLI